MITAKFTIRPTARGATVTLEVSGTRRFRETQTKRFRGWSVGESIIRARKWAEDFVNNWNAAEEVGRESNPDRQPSPLQYTIEVLQ